MREDRSQKSEDRGQKSKVRQRTTSLYSVVCVLSSALFFVFFYITSVWAGNVEDTIKSYIREHYPWAEIEIKGLSFDSNIPQGEVRRIYIDRRPPGRSLFTIQYANGEKLLVTADIKAFDWVVMSKRSQGKGYVLSEDDLYRTLMDISKIPRDAIKEIDEATGKALRRSIISNLPLTREMLAEGRVVKKGSKVMIIAESPNFVITTTGELRENSYVGSPAKALNLTSRKTVRGILIDENTLKVGF